MNSKERVHASLCRTNPDRVPVWMWFHPETVEILGKVLEIPAKFVSQAFEDDVRQAWVSNNYAMEGIVHPHDGESHIDQWGIEWVKDGPFNQIKHYPLADLPEEEILKYKFPFNSIPELLKNMDPVMALQKEYFIGCDVSPCLFEIILRLRNMTNAVIDFLANPKMMEYLLDGACEFAVKLSQEAVNKFPLDWLWTGDDVGGQENIIIDPYLWRSMVKPRLKKIVDVGKQKGLWVAYHSCGEIHAIIPDLIEIGVDVLNPVQCNCPGMNPLELKKEFGDKLSFMGGIDTQGTLPDGSVSEVRKVTDKLIQGMMKGGGGYILAASHTVPSETPVENIFAMYESAGITRERIFDNAAVIRMKVKNSYSKY
jgi:uroporphyrinogen decarboxylase